MIDRRSFWGRARPAWPCRPWAARVGRGAEAAARRPDRLRLVRQVRPVPADPGRAGRGGFAVRRRQADARRRGRHGRRAAGVAARSRATYGDYREMLKEKDLDIVLIATPDHWHALPMIAAVEAGADVYVQKPISVDVAEGQAMLAAARKHKRVVQVGTQRRSTPHLIEARDRIIREGQARQDRPGRDLLLLPHAGPRESARHRPAGLPRLRNVDRPGPDAAVQQAGPSARLAGVHGVRQRHRRRHVHPHARHGPLDARSGLARSGSPRPAASWSTRPARPTSPTPRPRRSTSATCKSSGSIAPGATRPIPSIPGARRSTATRGRSRPAS